MDDVFSGKVMESESKRAGKWRPDPEPGLLESYFGV
jgi:hypothetical protein